MKVVAWARSRQRILLSIAVFVTVGAVYTGVVRDWRFWRDDYGLAYEGHRLSSWADICHMFSTPTVFAHLPSNSMVEEQASFMRSMYRPCTTLMLAGEARLVGAEHQHATYVISIVEFASAMALLFYMLSLLVSSFLALIATAYCAFHPSITTWLGFLCMQPYILAILFLGVILLSLKRTIATGNYWWLLPAWLLFFVHLNMHEWFLVLPFWLLIAIPVYLRHLRITPRSGQLLLLIAPFFLLSIIYLVVKAAVFPMVVGDDQVGSFFAGLGGRFLEKVHNYEFVSLVVHVAGLNWLPAGMGIAKGLFLLLFAGSWLVLFRRTPYRREMAVCVVAAFFFTWPALVFYFVPRYGYLSTLFILVSFLIGVRTSVTAQRLLATGLVIFTIIGCSYNVVSLRALEKKSLLADRCLRQLAADIKEWPTGKTLIFAGVPEEWFPYGGTAQAVWLYSGRPDIPVCVHWRLQTRTVVTFEEPDSLYIPRADVLDIKLHGTTITMRVKDRYRLWLYGVGNRFCALGERIVHDHAMTPYGSRSYAITFTLAERWTSAGFDVITWNFEHQQFEWLKDGGGSGEM